MFVDTTARNEESAAKEKTVSFYGRHQAGVTSAMPLHLVYAAFDLTARAAGDLRELLRAWSAGAADLAAGRAEATDGARDVEEAVGLAAARLTLTFGFGASLFLETEGERLGVASVRPSALVELPQFRGDELERERTGGDLCVQACADDPQVCFHAIRTLARVARGVAVLRWLQ